MGWSEFEMNPKKAILNNAKLKILPLGKSVCDGNNLYFTRTGDGKGKFTYRYQRLGEKHEMGFGPWPAITLAEARQKARDARRRASSPIFNNKLKSGAYMAACLFYPSCT